MMYWKHRGRGGLYYLHRLLIHIDIIYCIPASEPIMYCHPIPNISGVCMSFSSATLQDPSKCERGS